MTNWQPIETAPKDGTDILVATSGGQYVVYWRKITDDYEEEGGWYVSTQCGVSQFLYDTPTHWMPLLERPV